MTPGCNNANAAVKSVRCPKSNVQGPKSASGNFRFLDQDFQITASRIPNPRSGCQRKAWGGAKRNPRKASNRNDQARGAGDSAKDKSSDRSILRCGLYALAIVPDSVTLSPASRANNPFGFAILGLAPQALCRRALRALLPRGAQLSDEHGKIQEAGYDQQQGPAES
jgi:hypothetical protein